MENTEIMNNEQVVETVEEAVVDNRMPKSLKIAGIVGLAMIAGYAAYRYIGKPLYIKLKKNKTTTSESQPADYVGDSLEEVVD